MLIKAHRLPLRHLKTNIHISIYNTMIDDLKDSLWKQFGASIDMLKNAITMIPDAYWNTDKKFF